MQNVTLYLKKNQSFVQSAEPKLTQWLSKTKMKYKRLNNFPEELTTLLKEEWDVLKTSEYDDIPCVEPSLKMVVCKSLNKKFQPYFKNVKIQGIVFAVSNPSGHVAKVHQDMTRHTTLNVPIEVDTTDSWGDYVSGKSEDLRVYGKPSPSQRIGNPQYDFNPSLFEFVPMTTPIIINTKVPHAWIGNKDRDRVIATFVFEDGLKPEELINSTPSDWF